jgi:hypothetical protein
MIDLTDPPWLVVIAFVAVHLGLIVWFPVYYWRKDRARRRAAGGER